MVSGSISNLLSNFRHEQPGLVTLLSKVRDIISIIINKRCENKEENKIKYGKFAHLKQSFKK